MGIVVALLVSVSQAFVAAPPPEGLPSVSLARVRKEIEKTPAIKLDIDADRAKLGKPVATFRTSVDERVYMLPFLEYLHKEFELNELQRQSSEWASKCCGFNLLSVPGLVKKGVRKYEAATARKQVTRELAEVEAVRKH